MLQTNFRQGTAQILSKFTIVHILRLHFPLTGMDGDVSDRIDEPGQRCYRYLIRIPVNNPSHASNHSMCFGRLR